MSTHGVHPFDADNHYYEALDAFTRHLDPAWGPRTFEWAEINGRQYNVLGGRVSRAVVNPWLPAWLPDITLRGLRVRDAVVDLLFSAATTAPAITRCCSSRVGRCTSLASRVPGR